jgi:hypothetical protein
MHLPGDNQELSTSSIFKLFPSNHSFSAHRGQEESELAEVLKIGLEMGGLWKFMCEK